MAHYFSNLLFKYQVYNQTKYVIAQQNAQHGGYRCLTPGGTVDLPNNPFGTPADISFAEAAIREADEETGAKNYKKA